ncbi:10356_t:CDS:1, partial [Paraglomus brasilianum]
VLSQQVPSGLTSLRWPDPITIFNEYYKAKVPLKAKFLPLFEKCQSDSVMKCLFDGYLAKLFGFKVGYRPPRTVCIPVLSSVDTVVQRTSKKRKANTKAVKKVKQKWLEQAVELNKEIENGKFKESLQKFMQGTDKSMQEKEDAGSTQSKRVSGK